MSQQYRYPASASLTLAAQGTTGISAPTSALEVAGVNNLGNLTALSIDASGNLLVSATALPLPSGAATSANQVLEIAQLTAINGKLPAALGAQTIAASLSVNIASNQTVPVSAASLPLPTGAATSALQTTGNTSVASIDTKTPALGQAAMAASVPVAIASNQSTLPVSAASLPLPTGAATETTLAAMSAKLPATLGQKAMSASMAVVLASDQASVPVAATQSGTWNITNISGTVSLPTGASTETTLSGLSAKFGSLGQKAMAGSAPVVIASDQSNLPTNIAQIGGNSVSAGQGVVGTGVQRIVQSVTATSAVTSVASSATSVSLLASNANRSGATFYNDSTATLYLKLGATASTTSYTVQILAGGYYELPASRVYTGAIDGIWASANGNARITELS